MGERFNALMYSLMEKATDFVETGTGYGVTANAIARDFDVPVWTCEVDPRCIEIVVLDRLNERLHLYQKPSDEFLRTIWLRLGNLPLFYLDAHDSESQPLLDELRIVTSTCQSAVILIHDFKVPGRDISEFRYLQTPCDNDFDYILPVLDGRNTYRFYLPDYDPPEGRLCTGYLVIFQNVESYGKLGDLIEWTG